MNLNNKNVILTGTALNYGEYLDELPITSVYEHMQATVYYENGLPDIDSNFKDKGYINNGYVCNLISYLNVITIVFIKYERDKPKDMGFFIIERSKIIRFEQESASNLTVVKKEESAHKSKYVLKRGFGAIGALGGIVADQFISVNTELVVGVKFKLFYKDTNDIEQCITMYSSDTQKHKTILFLNTYFKSELNNDAKKPVNESSTCFIATACYRDMFSEEVIFFRWYRDNKLINSNLGRLFIKFYYKTSPLIYRFLFDNTFYSEKVKYILDRIYLSLSKNSNK